MVIIHKTLIVFTVTIIHASICQLVGQDTRYLDPSANLDPKMDVKTTSEESLLKVRSTHEYFLLSEPWNKYFRSTPKILVMRKPPEGILRILDQQQALAKQVLDMNAGKKGGSDYAPLEERLSELKRLIPTAETASGQVTVQKRYGSYAYIGKVSTGGSYSISKEKHMSSSPELANSVENIVRNLKLDLADFRLRINSLQKLVSH